MVDPVSPSCFYLLLNCYRCYEEIGKNNSGLRGAQPWKGLSRTFPGLFTTTNKMKMLVWRHVSWMYMYPQDSLSSQLIQTYWSYPQTNSQYILVTSQFHHTESYSIHRGVGRGACSLYVELMGITSVLRKITLGGPITIFCIHWKLQFNTIDIIPFSLF